MPECDRETRHFCIAFSILVCIMCLKYDSVGYALEEKRIEICQNCKDGEDSDRVQSICKKGDELKVTRSLSLSRKYSGTSL